MPGILLHEYLAKIEEWIRSGEPGRAVAHTEHILAQHPECFWAHRVLGEACLESGHLAQAQKSFERTLAADPENAIAHIGMSLVHDRRDNLADAIWHMERASDVAAGNTEVRADLQTLYRRRGDSRASPPALTRGAMARVYARNGLFQRAIAEYQEALQQNPELVDARAGLAEVQWRAGLKEKALESCRGLLETLPGCLKALLIQGQLLQAGGQDAAAEATLAQAQAIDPENRVAHAVMGALSPLPLREVHVTELGAAGELAAGRGNEEDSMEEEESGAEETRSSQETGEAAEESLLAEPADSRRGAPGPGPAQDEELPDWLQEIAPGETPLPPSGVDEAAAEDQAPDWLETTATSGVSEAEEPSTAEEAPAGLPEPPPWMETPAEQAASGEEADLPAGGGDEGRPSLEAAALEAEEPGPGTAEPAAAVPDWVRRMEEAVTDEAPPIGAETFGTARAAAAEGLPGLGGSSAERQRIRELTHLLRLEPGKYWARIELARTCSMIGDWDGALLQYEELIAGHKMIRAVILDLQGLLEQETDKVQVYRLLGDAHMESNQIDQALEMYRLARQILRKR